jgi:hypothetical protein
MKIIKNPSFSKVQTIFRGKMVTVPARCSYACPDGEEGEALFTYLTQTYGFLIDKTPKVSYKAPKTNEEIKRVVHKAQPKEVTHKRRI